MLLFVVGVMVAVATIFISKSFLQAQRGSLAAEKTKSSLTQIEVALTAYAAINGRLPCPADPIANDGKSLPLAPALQTNCTLALGVVPWETIGISRDIALDGWNWLISYRVAEGATGLTQPNGASMVNCDTVFQYGGSLPPVPANGLCKALADAPAGTRNTVDQFLPAAKGLSVNDSGSIVQNVAYVLISHGESGFGAFLQGAAPSAMPAAGSDERINASAVAPGVPFVSRSHSMPGVLPGDIAHFDDIVVWKRISEFAKKSGLEARDWTDNGATVEISPTTLTDMNLPGQDHFNASTSASGVTYGAADTISDPNNSPDTLAFAGGWTPSGACAWWPKSFNLYNGTGRYSLRIFFEFSTSNSSSDFGGFTVGFLSKAATDQYAVSTSTPFTALCGDSSTSSDLAWDNGVSIPSLGNLQPPRFALEIDTYQDGFAPYLDPSSNHVATDTTEVRHNGVTAPLCSFFSDSYSGTGCYTGPNNTWLRDGLTVFHSLRIEVIPHDPLCSAGAAPKMRAWIVPNSTCSTSSTDSFCKDARNMFAPFEPIAPLPTGVIALERCIPAPPAPLPSPYTPFYDDMYFGFTAASRGTGTGPRLYIRNLGAGAYFIPTP